MILSMTLILDKGDNPHPTPTLRTDKRVYLINFTDHLRPAFGGHICFLFINDGGMGWINFCLALFAPVGIGVETVIADHDLAFVGNMGCDSGEELKIL